MTDIAASVPEPASPPPCETTTTPIEHDFEVDGVRIWELAGGACVSVDATSTLFRPTAVYNGHVFSGPDTAERLREAGRRLLAAGDYVAAADRERDGRPFR